MSLQTLKVVAEPGNLFSTVQIMIDRDAEEQLFQATVSSITGSTITIQRTGHDPETAAYSVIDSFPYPVVGDEVIVARVGRGFIVIGKVLRTGLVQRYLTIETQLTIGEGGSIVDADGSVWDQDGVTYVSDGDVETDFIKFVNESLPHLSILRGVISSALATATLGLRAQYRDIGETVHAEGSVSTSGQLDGGVDYIGRASASAAVVDDSAGGHAITLQQLTTVPIAGGSADQKVLLNSFSADEGNDAVNLGLMMSNISFASGQGIIGIGDAATPPTGNPIAAGFMYVVGGELLWRSSGGIITELTPGVRVIVKTADESVSSSAVLQDDDDLLFPVGANENWQFEGYLFVLTAGGVADIKYTFSGPAGSVGSWFVEAIDGSFVNDRDELGNTGIGGNANAGAPFRALRFWGAIATAGAAGNLQFEWAQNASHATATVVHAGSYIQFQKET